jgi:hypothetical protein
MRDTLGEVGRQVQGMRAPMAVTALTAALIPSSWNPYPHHAPAVQAAQSSTNSGGLSDQEGGRRMVRRRIAMCKAYGETSRGLGGESGILQTCEERGLVALQALHARLSLPRFGAARVREAENDLSGSQHLLLYQ